MCIVFNSSSYCLLTECRRVFRGDYFKPRVYYFDDPDASYETFLKGSYGISLENGNSDRSHYDWRILTPGDHAGIQKLLGWLVISHNCSCYDNTDS